MKGRDGSLGTGKSFAMGVHENRFTLPQDFDKSPRLANIRRVVGHDFSTYKERNSAQLIRQGGNDEDLDILDETWQFYDNTMRGKHTLERLDKNCISFNKVVDRTHDKSIYKRDWGAMQDPYDVNKVDLGKIKTTKNSQRKAHYSLQKQTNRNYDKVI